MEDITYYLGKLSQKYIIRDNVLYTIRNSVDTNPYLWLTNVFGLSIDECRSIMCNFIGLKKSHSVRDMDYLNHILVPTISSRHKVKIFYRVYSGSVIRTNSVALLNTFTGKEIDYYSYHVYKQIYHKFM